MIESEPIIEIDGSYGEGGGQILRTALACSAILKKPIRLNRIRAGRKNPGLQPQHLKSIEALILVSKARAEGIRIGSEGITFFPGEIVPGEYAFDIGTAGSVTLLLQTLILPLACAQRESRLTLVGGTHVEWSPPYHYFAHIFLPVLASMGIRIEADIKRWGWYPRGRGRIDLNIHPASRLMPLTLNRRGSLKKIYGISATSNLPGHIAERQRAHALRSIERELNLEAEIEILLNVPSKDEGSFLFLVVESEGGKAGFSSLGKRGKRAETVADEVVDSLKDYLQSNACLDCYLPDQLVPFMAFAQGLSSLTTSRITEHLLTNLWVIQHFLKLSVSTAGGKGEEGKIDLIGGAY